MRRPTLKPEERLNREELREYKRMWKLMNPGYMLEKSRLYSVLNRKRISVQAKAYRKRHREECIQRHREWYAKNPEKARECARKWRLRNLDRARAAGRAWAKRNGPKRVEYVNRRRAKMYEGGVNCIARIQELTLHGDCYWCGEELTKQNRTVDHVMPLTRGGKHVPDNLVACCRPCNQRKKAKLPQDWIREINWNQSENYLPAAA